MIWHVHQRVLDTRSWWKSRNKFKTAFEVVEKIWVSQLSEIRYTWYSDTLNIFFECIFTSFLPDDSHKSGVIFFSCKIDSHHFLLGLTQSKERGSMSRNILGSKTSSKLSKTFLRPDIVHIYRTKQIYLWIIKHD